MDVLKVFENRQEERLDEVSGTHFVCVQKGVARRRANEESAQSCRFEPKPVADAIGADGIRKLGEEHGRQMAENAESVVFFFNPNFLGYLVANASRYKV